MNPEIEKLINEYKEKLHAAGAAFLVVYAYKHPLTGANICQISSDSSKQGIRAILHSILEPTREARNLLARAFHDTANAACGTLRAAIDKAAGEGAFTKTADNLFEMLRPYWTIKGWEKDETQKPS
jgi:hypothetical protein